jgi:hypothetical protein
MFNALKYIKNLEDVGFPREQAEAQVQLVIDSFQENVATRTDMAELCAEMSDLKSELKTEMSELRAELKGDISALKVDMAHLKSDLVFRLGGIIVFCTGVLGILIKF